MRTTLMTMLAVSLAAGCATAAGPEAPTASAPAAARVGPVLRLLDIIPADGAPVDSATVLVATVAYRIPDFDPGRSYVVSAVFAAPGGGTFNRAGGHEECHLAAQQRGIAASCRLLVVNAEPAEP